VATQGIDARIGVEEEMTFQLDRRGPSVLEIEVQPGPDELTLANNRAAVVVNGVRDRLRVLLVSGEPHAGERAWRNILKSDPSVACCRPGPPATPSRSASCRASPS